MRPNVQRRVLTIVCTMIITLCMLTQGVFAAEVDEQTDLSQQETSEPAETEPEEDGDSGILDAITSLPDEIVAGIVDAIMRAMDSISNAFMDGIIKWNYAVLLNVAETVFSGITNSTSNVFNYPWFRVIAGLFSRFGMLLFAIGVVLAIVDIGIEYRRRGVDLSGAMLNLGKGLMAVGLFSVVPVPLFNFCASIQSVILQTLSINWSFQSIIDALVAGFQQGFMVIILVIMIVLMFLVYLDSLKRGGILLVMICIGSLHMISVPRGYLDNFYGWCKQIIALCITVLLQNLLMFCGLMIVPTNLFLGLGVMFAAKEVPSVCAQFGLDTSAKVSFSNAAMGANAAVQAIKAASTLFV